jgi:hypothetical protein
MVSLIEKQVQTIFDPLKKIQGTIPTAGIMKDSLERFAPRGKNSTCSIRVNEDIAKLFGSASIEMWLRAVHSFLISSSLTRVSDLWSSVAGYYSSHYTMRAMAHLLGYFHLRRKGFIVNLQPTANSFICEYVPSKGVDSREHTFYWKIVKEYGDFISNDLFTVNTSEISSSDASHRNFANYIDHLDKFPTFLPLSLDDLKERIEFLSKVKISAYPIPDSNKYPDIESVQLIAYHRLVFYRNLLNNILGDSNRFWKTHRNPSWCQSIINFQLVSPTFLENFN